MGKPLPWLRKAVSPVKIERGPPDALARATVVRPGLEPASFATLPSPVALTAPPTTAWTSAPVLLRPLRGALDELAGHHVAATAAPPRPAPASTVAPLLHRPFGLELQLINMMEEIPPSASVHHRILQTKVGAWFPGAPSTSTLLGNWSRCDIQNLRGGMMTIVELHGSIMPHIFKAAGTATMKAVKANGGRVKSIYMKKETSMEDTTNTFEQFDGFKAAMVRDPLTRALSAFHELSTRK